LLTVALRQPYGDIGNICDSARSKNRAGAAWTASGAIFIVKWASSPDI
jgi:hypothetical protein